MVDWINALGSTFEAREERRLMRRERTAWRLIVGVELVVDGAV